MMLGAAYYMAYSHFPVPGWMVTVIVVIVILLIVTAGQNRRYNARTNQRICRGCANANPPFAHFCRRCGRSLD